MMNRIRLHLSAANVAVGIGLLVVFVARLLISGRNSYWFDEIWSVDHYGLRSSSGFEAMRQDPIHPPLYPVLLHYWIQLFGDGEVATRCLSNLYVALAGLCVYLATREFIGPVACGPGDGLSVAHV
jgi:uncharacterized membrane protein